MRVTVQAAVTIAGLYVLAYLLLLGYTYWLHKRVLRIERRLPNGADRLATDTEPPKRPPTGKPRPFIPAAPPGPDPNAYLCHGCDTMQDKRAHHACSGARGRGASPSGAKP